MTRRRPGRQRLSIEMTSRIVALRAVGWSPREIVALTGVSVDTVMKYQGTAQHARAEAQQLIKQRS